MAEGEQASITALPASVEELVKLRAGSRVAVLDFLGSLCPITLGHVACLREARSVLCGVTPSQRGICHRSLCAICGVRSMRVRQL